MPISSKMMSYIWVRLLLVTPFVLCSSRVATSLLLHAVHIALGTWLLLSPLARAKNRHTVLLERSRNHCASAGAISATGVQILLSPMTALVVWARQTAAATISASVSPLRMCLKPMRIICDGVSAAGAYARTLLAGLWFRLARKPLQHDTDETSSPFAWAFFLAVAGFGSFWLCWVLFFLAILCFIALLLTTTLNILWERQIREKKS